MIGRRDIFKFAGGSALGLAVSPAPWRLITDTALWSQDWPGVPKPPRGESKIRYTNCTLCPAGCGMRVRCIGEQPVSMTGAAADPAGHGALCPFGITGHHLPYHPARLKQALHRGKPCAAEEAAAAITRAVEKVRQNPAAGSLAILDLRPGRTASWIYRRSALTFPNGVYIAPLEGDGATFRTVNASLAPDLDKVRTVLSLATPLLDGWGTPGRVLRARDGFRLIQAEPAESRTATLADQWLPIRAGSEAALALGIAGELLRRRLYDRSAEKTAGFDDFARGAAAFRLETAADLTGIASQTIAAVAGELAAYGPALVVGDGDAAAGSFTPGEQETFAALQMLLGLGALVERRPTPPAWKDAAPVTPLAALPDRSVRVLLVDESAAGVAVPWNLVWKKLTRADATVVTFTCAPGGYSRYADYALPAPVFPETVQDQRAAPDAPVAGFRISAALVQPPAGMIEPASFVARAAGLNVALGDAIKERAAAIHAAGRGTLVTYADAKSVPVKDTAFEDFWKTLNEGACWLDEALASAPTATLKLAFHEPPAPIHTDHDLPLIAVPVASRGVAAGPLSPLMSKLYQESDLRLPPNGVLLHPETAQQAGVEEGARAILQTECGRCEVRVAIDAGIMPGVVELAVGPAPPGGTSVLDICSPGAYCTWRLTRAKVVRA